MRATHLTVAFQPGLRQNFLAESRGDEMVCRAFGALRALAALAAVIFLFNGVAHADVPTVFAVLTSQSGKAPEVRPNEELRLRVDGNADLSPEKIQLLIDGSPWNRPPTIQGREIIFHLKRSDENLPSLKRILGSALDQRKTVFIGLKINDTALKYRTQSFGADESPQPKVDFLPAEPSVFAIVKQGDTVPVLKLGHKLRVRLDGDTPVDESKAQLRIDGELLNVTPRRFHESRELVFPLERNEKNRALWSRLLGSPLSNENCTKTDCTVRIAVEVGGRTLKYKEEPLSGDEAPQATLAVEKFNFWLMILGLAGVFVVVFISFWLARTTTLVRDTLIPQMRLRDRTYSLGRLQMLVWFCLIFSSFTFIFAVTLDLNSITAESFILLGISASTALAAVAVDRSKANAENDPLEKACTALEALGLKTSQQVDDLYKAQKDDPTQKAAPKIVPATTQPDNSQLTVGELWRSYEEAIKEFRSRSLTQDLVNDKIGPTIHRWQILVWTLALGVIYIVLVYSRLETPTFGTNLLALMGISGGIYLGFKIPERQA